MTSAAQTEACFETEDRRARGLLRDLHTPRQARYWTDLVLSAAIGWSAFAAAARMSLSPAMILCAAVAVFALYRGLSFLHEISHINQRSLRGFEPAWNLLFGFPLLMPSLMYVGVHQAHHSLRTYGTSEDPEYLPFARSRRMTVAFAAESFLIPAVLLLRFLLLSPVGLIVPRFQRGLAERASALTMNLAYRREPTPELLARLRWCGLAILALWLTAIAVFPIRVFVLWFGVLSVASFINTVRTLAAHKYESGGEPTDRESQLRDSIDTPGGVWTELWAPAGLRYHALHHYFPGIPYHNLAEAHRRLVSALPARSVYAGSRSSGLVSSLGVLMRGASRVR